MGAHRVRLETRITGSPMKKVRTFICAVLCLALLSSGGAAFAQAAKNGAPPPAGASADQPTTSVVVPSQAPSPRDNTAAGTEVVENPYGIEALWKQGDFIARGTLIILIIMSIGTWYIGIVKYIEQARLFKDWREADEKFWDAKGGVTAGAALLDRKSVV